MPLVSVIIPTYNRALLLPRAVASVCAQTFTDFECIVVDDGSTDETSAFLGNADLPDAVRHIRFPGNRGVAAARNAGVAAATGLWLAFLDSDDEWNRAKLSLQMEWHALNPEFRISQTKEIWIRGGVRVNPPATHEKVGGFIFEQCLHRCMITPSSVVIRESLFREAGGFNESFPACEDYDLWLRITSTCPVGLVDKYLLTRYGGHDDQLSATVPGLDRFRIQSIINALGTGRLSASQVSLARATLVTKALIVANGSKKRGKIAEYEQYSDIARTYGLAV
jgi:glycosyltransferase involved in cell wall biosynthesis